MFVQQQYSYDAEFIAKEEKAKLNKKNADGKLPAAPPKVQQSPAAPPKTQPESEATTDLKDTSSDDVKKGAQNNDVISASRSGLGKQAKWTSDCASILPKFSLVKENTKSVEDWANAVLRVLEEYWGQPLK